MKYRLEMIRLHIVLYNLKYLYRTPLFWPVQKVFG